MKDFIIKETRNKGLGVFALRNFKRGEHIFHIDLTKLKRYNVIEIDGNSELNGDHSDYVGHGKYVVNHSPATSESHASITETFILSFSLVGSSLRQLEYKYLTQTLH